MLTAAQVKERISCDQCVKRNGIFTVRKGFYYTFGKTTQDLVDAVVKAFPNANILDSGRIWKDFKGGAPIQKQSHWFVKFSLGEDNK